MRYRLYLVSLRGNTEFPLGTRYWVTKIERSGPLNRTIWTGTPFSDQSHRTFSKCQADWWWKQVYGWFPNVWQPVIEPV